MSHEIIGILGATSLIGEAIIRRAQDENVRIVALSRRKISDERPGVSWYTYKDFPRNVKITSWICLTPIWLSPDYYDLLEQCGARRVISFSSTSRYTKSASNNSHEINLVSLLKEGEEKFIDWAQRKSVDWCIFRPTLVYGLGRDKNVSELLRIIKRYRFFPVLGTAQGSRQPVHVDDLAIVSMRVILSSDLLCDSFNLSGGEVLTYRELIARLFSTLGVRPLIIRCPVFIYRFATLLIRLVPRYRNWNFNMVERMNQVQAIDNTKARNTLNFRPREFRLGVQDIPKDIIQK